MESFSTTDLNLEQVQSHFKQWRATRTKRTKIPETLWQEVFHLTKRYPQTIIVKALCLNTSQLKTKMQTYDNVHNNFIKIESLTPPIPTSSEDANCIIQLTHQNGSHMTIQLHQHTFLKEVITTFIHS